LKVALGIGEPFLLRKDFLFQFGALFGVQMYGHYRLATQV
jgi:hypothetical protein